MKGKLNGVTDYSDEMEIANIPSQISVPADEIRQLRNEISELKSQLQKPLIQKVKNLHYLSKPFLACIAMTAIIIGLCIWLGNEMDIVSREKKNVPDYRSVNSEIRRDENIGGDLGSPSKINEEKINAHKGKIKPGKQVQSEKAIINTPDSMINKIKNTDVKKNRDSPVIVN